MNLMGWLWTLAFLAVTHVFAWAYGFEQGLVTAGKVCNWLPWK